MTPDEYCQNKAAKSGSSFYYSFLFLPPAQRRAITALYAFCREVDDIVDNSTEQNIAKIKLQWWRDTMQHTFSGQPQHPIQKALTPFLSTMDLPLEYFLEIIDGMQMDLTQTRFETFNDLSLYCYRVASVVGLMAAEIFGFENRLVLKYAHNLGMAFQLTNIIRDIKEDAMRGRIYIPSNELQQFHLTEQDILQLRQSENMDRLIAFQIDRAQQYYDKAYSFLPDEDRFAQRSGLIMAAIYRSTLDRISKDSRGVLRERVSLTPIRKLWIAWTTARKEKKRHKRLLQQCAT